MSKKIAIPNQVKLNCITWNRDQGWIACGGDQALLKVLKLETKSGPDAKIMGVAAPSDLSMNQNLEGHNGGVVCAVWNPVYKKLTTSDESGLIIVWMLHKGQWYEEMINNRNKSVVKDMKWTNDGKKICIIYEDGAVIVGSVDGNRIWGKELGVQLRYIEWSPDNRIILFVTSDSEVLIFDENGNKLRTMSLQAMDAMVTSADHTIVGVSWFSPPAGRAPQSFSGSLDSHPPSLCIAFDSGHIMLARNDSDPAPIILDTELIISFVKWDCSGSIISVAGSVKSSSGGKVFNVIKFYDPFGRFMRFVKIPGDRIASLSWEGTGLRIALAVDSFIYFANIRPSYCWCSLQNTLVYSYSRIDRKDSSVVFWDSATNESNIKIVPNLRFITASSYGDYCSIVWCERLTGSTAVTGPGGLRPKDSSTAVDVYHAQLRNAVGAVLDSKIVPFSPRFVSMGSTHFVAANARTVFIWQFQTAQNISTGEDATSSNKSRSTNQSKIRLFDIEVSMNNLGSVSVAQSPELFQIINDPTNDPISCLTVSDKYIAIARKSGIIIRYNLPHLNAENHFYNVRNEPFRIEFNCTSTKLGLIDANGIFMILNLDIASPPNSEEKAELDSSGNVIQNENANNDPKLSLGIFGRRSVLERKDVWDMKWAADNEDSICIMEKTKMVILHGENMEEPIVSSAFIAQYKDLEVKAVFLDDILAKVEESPTADSINCFESKSLREMRERISAEGINAGYAVASASPHPRLWRLLAQSALEELDLNMAERALVRCGDYFGLQLVKQLRTMVLSDKMKARAEVAVYLSKFDEAEIIYREIDRKDLAVQFRKKIGDNQRVFHLLQHGNGNDAILREAFDKIGQQYMDKYKWKTAIMNFEKSGNYEKLAECYFRLEHFKELSDLRHKVPDGYPLLGTLATYFEGVGMYEEAVDCHIRYNQNVKAAIDCCVTLNQWEKALALAEQYDYPQVYSLLDRYATTLNNNDKWLEAIELFRRANRPSEAAHLIGIVAEKAARKELKPSFAKKLHVLAAMEIERHRKKASKSTNTAGATNVGGTTNIAQTTAATLDSLMMTNLESTTGNTTFAGTTVANTGGGTNKASRAFAWYSAAAYHYYMLAQRQFYDSNYDAAMKTSIKLCEYDDILDPRDIYCLLALTSLRNKFFGICSKAFVKLETLPSLSDKERDDIQTLAVKVFSGSDRTPQDPSPLGDEYMKCIDMGKSYKACIISGRAILQSASTDCRNCRYSMLDHEREKLLKSTSTNVAGKENCPLCHSPLVKK